VHAVAASEARQRTEKALHWQATPFEQPECPLDAEQQAAATEVAPGATVRVPVLGHGARCQPPRGAAVTICLRTAQGRYCELSRRLYLPFVRGLIIHSELAAIPKASSDNPVDSSFEAADGEIQINTSVEARQWLFMVSLTNVMHLLEEPEEAEGARRADAGGAPI
jgi:hypothetical protein